MARHSTYNALAPLDPPTSDWSYTFTNMKYNTLSDYYKAFARLSQLGTYVGYSNNIQTFVYCNTYICLVRFWFGSNSTFGNIANHFRLIKEYCCLPRV